MPPVPATSVSDKQCDEIEAGRGKSEKEGKGKSEKDRRDRKAQREGHLDTQTQKIRNESLLLAPSPASQTQK